LGPFGAIAIKDYSNQHDLNNQYTIEEQILFCILTGHLQDVHIYETPSRCNTVDLGPSIFGG